MIEIGTRNYLKHTRSTPRCKSCNAQLQYSQPSYLLILRIDGRTFTPHVCPACNKLRDPELFWMLREWVRKHTEDSPKIDYMKFMARQELPQDTQ